MIARPTAQECSEVDELVCGMPGRRSEDRPFCAPWEIRAFAIAVAAHKEGRFDWPAFQRALIESISEWEGGVEDPRDPSWSYYQHWLSALERVLADQGGVDSATLEEQTRDVLATPPNRNHHKANLEPVAIDPANRTAIA